MNERSGKMNIIEELRTKPSRDNRELLDRAANEIEDLERNLKAAYAKMEELNIELRAMCAAANSLKMHSEHLVRGVTIVK